MFGTVSCLKRCGEFYIKPYPLCTNPKGDVGGGVLQRRLLCYRRRRKENGEKLIKVRQGSRDFTKKNRLYRFDWAKKEFSLQLFLCSALHSDFFREIFLYIFITTGRPPTQGRSIPSRSRRRKKTRFFPIFKRVGDSKRSGDPCFRKQYPSPTLWAGRATTYKPSREKKRKFQASFFSFFPL